MDVVESSKKFCLAIATRPMCQKTTSIISMHSDRNMRCRVCGYKSEDPIWGEDGQSPLYDFCPCCGVEHGYQDSSSTGARNYRAAWIAAGAKWEEPQAKPDAWDLGKQLRHVPHEFE